MSNKKWRIGIDGLPKNLSIRKLAKLLNRYNKSWQLEELIPLEEHIMANICCETKESYDCFLKLPDLVPFSSFPNIRVYNAALIRNCDVQNNTIYATNDSIFKLNADCLRLVFEKCHVRDQIKFAKVCRKFHNVIVDIFSKKYTAFLFSMSIFKSTLALSDEEIWDFSILCGPYVRTLEFSTLFSMDYVTQVTRSKPKPLHKGNKGNIMGNCRKQINIWFCRHLVHFPQVRRVEVLGFFFLDFTARELARYCAQVREFLILDINSQGVTGKNFHLLRHLEVLELPVCPNLRQIYMLKNCKKLQLKELYIVENKRLMYSPFLKRILALQFTSLKLLWITAISNQTVISAILALPHLETLKLYWIDSWVSFEKMLFKELLRLRRDSLYALCWETEPPFRINEMYVDWKADEYEIRREKTAINGWPWKCFANYAEWLNLLCGCTAIEKMSFRYSRILTDEQLLALPRMCKTLEKIEIVGCRQQFDEELLHEWKAQTRPSCQLCIEGMSWFVVKPLQDKDLAFRKERKPVYRSILCNFK